MELSRYGMGGKDEGSVEDDETAPLSPKRRDKQRRRIDFDVGSDGKAKEEEKRRETKRRTRDEDTDFRELVGFPVDALDTHTITAARQHSGIQLKERQISDVQMLASRDSVSRYAKKKHSIVEIARSFAHEVGALRTEEQVYLYEVLKNVATEPDDVDRALKTWERAGIGERDDDEDRENGGHRRWGPGRNSAGRSSSSIGAFLDLIRGRSAEDLSTATLSGIVNGLLAVGFNCVKATLVFGQSSTTSAWIPIGVCMYHFATIVSGSSMTAFSDCRIAIGGPDIKHPLIFGPTIAAAIATSITGLSDTGGGTRRALSGTDYDEDELLSSIIFAMAFSTLLTSACWYSLGYFRLTRAVQFLPEFVVSGFIASVGYLIILKAIFVATNAKISLEISDFHLEDVDTARFYYLLAPAVAVGVPMFFTKQYHIGKPVHILPAFLVLPLVLFYIVLAASGKSVSDARNAGWFLETFQFTPFYEPWASVSVRKINFGVVFEQLPNMLVLTLVLTINALMNLVAVRNEYDVELDYNREMTLCGAYNFLNTAGLAAPGCLLKFTSINHGIVHNIYDKFPGVVYALFAGVVYASGYPIINFFPRFFLAALILFAGFGFIWTHAVETFYRFPRLEYATIVVIILITALTQLMYAVIAGILIALLIFVWKYARRGAIRSVYSGSDTRSRVVRSYRDEQSLDHLGQLFVVVELHRFLFFGSVIAVQEEINAVLSRRAAKPSWKRERYMLLNFESVDGIDVTATMVFTQIAKSCRSAGVQLIAAGQNNKTRGKFSGRDDGWTDIVRLFSDADAATEWIENQLLRHASDIRRRWLVIEPLRKLHTQTVLMAKHEAYEELLGGHLGESLWQYVTTAQVERGQRLCSAGEVDSSLYLLQSGRLTCYVEDSASGRTFRMMTWTRGAYVNEDSLFIDMPVSHTIVADERSIVLVITRRMWCQLEADDPMVALQIQRTVMMHSAIMRSTLERRLNISKKRRPASSLAHAAYGGSNSSERGAGGGGQRATTTHAKFASSVKMAVNIHGDSETMRGDARSARRVRSSIGGPIMHVQSLHDFHHIPHGRRRRGATAARGGSAESRRRAESNVVANTHMSRRMVKLTEACFEKHLEAKVSSATSFDGAEQHKIIGWFAPPSPKLGVESEATKIDAREGEMLLSFEDAQDALMDLGKFPTLTELREILLQISKDRGMEWKVFKRSLRKGVSRSLFVDIVSALDLAEISMEDLRNYKRVFAKYAAPSEEGTSYLSAEGLGLLMAEMHHEEQPLELQKLMAEWTTPDGGGGKLDFNNFVSMMAHFLKMEELDEEVEDVFKSFCHRWTGTGTFDADDLRTTMRSQYCVDISREEANEMIWEADHGDEGALSYRAFRNSVSMVSEADMRRAIGVSSSSGGTRREGLDADPLTLGERSNARTEDGMMGKISFRVGTSTEGR